MTFKWLNFQIKKIEPFLLNKFKSFFLYLQKNTMNKFSLIIVSSFLIASCSGVQKASTANSANEVTIKSEQITDSNKENTTRKADKTQPDGVLINDNNGLSKIQPQTTPSEPVDIIPEVPIPMAAEEGVLNDTEKKIEQKKKKKGQ